MCQETTPKILSVAKLTLSLVVSAIMCKKIRGLHVHFQRSLAVSEGFSEELKINIETLFLSLLIKTCGLFPILEERSSF